jgi:hypothetical protein
MSAIVSRAGTARDVENFFLKLKGNLALMYGIQDLLTEVRMTLRGLLSVTLAVLTLPLPGWSQAAADNALKVTVVEGEGARNSIRARSATPPVVEVHDERGEPVSGADVVFQLPAMGPGGAFYGWLRTNAGRTDARGRVAAGTITPNDEEGRFNIMVTAKSGTKMGTLVVHQINTRDGSEARAKSSHKTLWVVLAVAAAGAIGGGVAASRRGDSSTAVVPVPVTISPGVVTVGGPR